MSGKVSIQNSLSAGEFSPSLYGRTDLEKWHAGTSTCRNFFASYRGGVTSRAGLAYVGTCKQPGTSAPPRDIPFQFSLNQGFVLEFGDQYMRIKTDGAYVTEATKNITGATKASPGVFTITSHGYSVNDWIYITGMGGMTQLNGLTWIVNSVPTANTFTLRNLFGTVVNSTAFGTYTSGGTAARIYTVVAPYAAVDLPYLKYTQSADVMTLTCVNTGTSTEYPSYSLARIANTNWVFTVETFTANITAPTNVSVTFQASAQPSTWYSYVVTAIDSETGEESIASSIVSVQNVDISLYSGSNTVYWDPVAGASSYNVYVAPPSYSQQGPISSIFGYVGTALGSGFVDNNVTPDFTIVPPVHKNPFSRSAITDVLITNDGDGNYSQSTIGYSISTATGSGFVGTPVVSNGNFTGFIIKNNGKGYAGGDTVTITDSGGGVARGYYEFTSGNPSNGETVDLNGDSIKFVDSSSPNPNEEVHIQGTLALSIQALAIFLNTINNISLNSAIYTSDATKLYITYKTPGSAGNAYTMAAGSYGGTPSGATLTGGGTAGTGAAGTLVIGPVTGTYPAVATYYQQRRTYANSLNQPDTYWMTQPGLYNNMDSSIPVTDSDAITGTPWAQQVNGIQWLVPMPGGLVILTGKGAWQLNGGTNAALTPSSQVATPQAYNGCNDTVPPITINYDILYVQSKGSIIRDLSYNFFVNIYTGTDLTVLSNHLFDNFSIVQWAWSEEPYKLLWVVRDDGIMLCLTYLKEQEVFSWTRHDTNGLFIGVCSVTEPPVDAVYVITRRYVQGSWRYYSERMDDRIWESVEDSFCVDSGLKNTLTYPNAILSPAAYTGTNIAFTSSASVFTAGNVGDIIRVDGGKAEVVSYTSGTSIHCDILENLTTLVPNDPNHRPVPALSGSWSIVTPVTTVTGLNHLEGLEVSILADGSVVDNQTVTNGAITLDQEASLIVIGLPYVCQVQTLYIDSNTEASTVQNRRKNISSVGVRVEGTRGLTVGSDQIDSSTQPNFASPPWSQMNEIKERTNTVYAGTAIPLYTGDYYKNISSSWSVKGQVAFEQAYPLPATILAVIYYWNIGDNDQ